MKRALLVGAVVAAALGASLHAHDAEHTAVSITFARDGWFEIEVANDPNWLLLRLESFAQLDGRDGPKRAEAGSREAGVRDARLRELASVFVDRIVFFVDGHEVRPVAAEYMPPPPQAATGPAPLGGYRLRGRIAPDARVLRWYYGMVVDPYPLAIDRADGRSVSEWIVAGDAWSGVIDLTGQFHVPTPWELAARYLGLGYARIVPRGTGHLLFILGLCLLGAPRAAIAKQIAAFTIAHASALWLTAYGVLTLSPNVTAWLVSASVAYVVMENLLTKELKPWRVPAVLAFGLAHGVAFGSGVRELALTRPELATATAWFTAGIEIAQATVLAVAWVVLIAASPARRDRAVTATRTR
jgi:HupE / UreJ protein